MPFSSLTSRLGPQQDRDRIPPLLVVDLGRRHYSPVLDLQHRLRVARKLDRIEDLLLLTEHDPVITTGRRAGRENILVSHDFLQEKNVTLLSTERGGDITFHGPGQLVGYPILKIPGHGRQVKDYVTKLEDVLLHTLSRFGLRGRRMPGKPGIWTGDAKIAFIGLALMNGVCFHGFALNVDMDLTPFSWIHPCGLRNTEITCMKDLMDTPPSMKEVKQVLVSAFSSRMGLPARGMATRELEDRLEQESALSPPTMGALQDGPKT